MYTRSDAFVLHRPFDGGVQLGNFLPSHGASISRQTKKYMRYQSGKGVLWTSGVLFNPVMNLDQISAAATTAGSLITVTTELDHGLQVGATVEIAGVVTSGYNGTYGINTITSEIHSLWLLLVLLVQPVQLLLIYLVLLLKIGMVHPFVWVRLMIKTDYSGNLTEKNWQSLNDLPHIKFLVSVQ